MADFTTYVSLELPKNNEKYNVAAANKNAMIIDSELHKLEQKNESQDNLLATKASLNAETLNIRQLIDTAYASSNGYTDAKIAALINGAPSTLDTLKEVADALEDNETVVEALNNAIGTKAPQAELALHANDNMLHVSQIEKNSWNTPAFAQASIRENINSEENISILWGKVKKFFSDLKTVAFSASYNDLSDLPASLPANGGNADTVNGYTVSVLSESDYQSLTVKDPNTIYYRYKEQ